MRDANVDPYLSPSGVLRNLAGISDAKVLEETEAGFSTLRLFQLGEIDMPGDFDLVRMRQIHKHLFQDSYDWAGEIRTVDISKNGQRFANQSRIVPEAAKLFSKLKSDNALIGLPPDEFVDKLAHLYNEMNVLHPFREGNGRTTRVFINQLASKSGLQINFAAVSQPDWVKANRWARARP